MPWSEILGRCLVKLRSAVSDFNGFHIQNRFSKLAASGGAYNYIQSDIKTSERTVNNKKSCNSILKQRQDNV